jgi:hypothetical protein
MLGLSLASFVMAEELPDTNGIDMLWKGKHKENKNKHGNHALSQAEWLQVAMCINSVRLPWVSQRLLTFLQLYTSFLALISVLARPRCSRLVTNHLVAILLVTFSVYVYRDLVPLTTFSEHPQDRGEGWILWAKAVAITLTAVVIPLTIPRQYIPFDPEVSIFT